MAGAVWGGLIFTSGILAYAPQDLFGLQGEWLSLGAALLLIVMLVQRRGTATAIFYRERKPARSLLFMRRDGSADTEQPAEDAACAELAS